MEKIKVLSSLEEMGTKIRHQANLWETKQVNHKIEESYQIEKSLDSTIRDYIKFCVISIREGSIFLDPYRIIYNCGFKTGSIGQKIASKHISNMLATDKDGFFASIQLDGARRMGFSTAMVLSTGAMLVYDHSRKIISMIKNGVVFIMEAIKEGVQLIWMWIVSTFEKLSPKQAEAV